MTRAALLAAVRNLERASGEQKAVNGKALSVYEEFRPSNSEPLTSKEELQSINKELTALNVQLHETLDRQRTTSNDLKNVLYSTDVVTLVLDLNFKIRFFTPATRAMFNVIPGDVGRPLADLRSLASDTHLAEDARAVLRSLRPIDREIETVANAWFIRRILPYRSHNNIVEGVVITFTDISECKRIRKELEQAKLEAEQANRAKPRFLAAASHDLRQPLQTIALLQGLLTRTVEGDKARNLVKRLDDTLQAMSGMLNALLDINQIEAGVVRADMVSYPLNELFDRLRDEFLHHTRAKDLVLKVLPCRQLVHTDPRLLEQLLRNLLTNAIKYTRSGKVLLGCRRRGGSLSLEIWDTGIGIPDADLQTIFEEYHQLDNAARERSCGLGLGLSIVQRLVALLGYKVHVRSRLGKGSVFAIEIPLPPGGVNSLAKAPSNAGDAAPPLAAAMAGRSILVVEGDPDVRELLALMLEAEGHHATVAFDGPAALDQVERGMLKPDLMIADFKLPKGMDGLQVAARLRGALRRPVPVIILTGDTSASTLTEIARNNFVHLTKPVKLKTLMAVFEALLAEPHSRSRPAVTKPADAAPNQAAKVVFVVDDDQNIRDSMGGLLVECGYAASTFPNCESFLAQYRQGDGGCLLVDANLTGMDGFALLRTLRDANDPLPTIMMTGQSNVPMAVQAMKAGAIDFIEKPVGHGDLLASVERAMQKSREVNKVTQRRSEAQGRIASLTERQREIMELVLRGHPSKNIAADLSISQRTVENHRNAIMCRTGCKSLPALARLALTAAPGGGGAGPA